ncbi:MAG TPA: glycosyltransferase, partial [Acetobacteraceae bacterium]|nr:glycosyltransferase [Acetobacteraceae bacterium]
MRVPGRLDVVMRLHDARRGGELGRAVFSLVGQRHRPLHVLLCVQRFTRGMILDVREALAPLLAMAGAPTLDILNHEAPLPLDARASLANLGMAAAEGRYLAFLDYDDTLYPEAHALLVARLRATGAAIAFAGIAVKHAEIEDDLLHVQARQERHWRGRTLRDLFHDNCCPLHSFVIDRTRLPA